MSKPENVDECSRACGCSVAGISELIDALRFYRTPRITRDARLNFNTGGSPMATESKLDEAEKAASGSCDCSAGGRNPNYDPSPEAEIRRLTSSRERARRERDDAEGKLSRLRTILTSEVLTELGSEQHEIIIPDLADEVRRILHGS